MNIIPNIIPKNPKRVAVYSALGTCVAAGVAIAAADLPTWTRVFGAAVALLAGALGVACSWPTVRDMIHGRDA